MDDIDNQQILEEIMDRKKREIAEGNLAIGGFTKPQNKQEVPEVIGAAEAWSKTRKIRRE